MKNFNYLLFLIFNIILLFSCNKEDFVSNNDDTTELAKFVSKSPNVNSNGEKMTIIGSKRANPFTIANMNLAYEELYPDKIGSLSTTHKYIRFEPSNEAEMHSLTRLDLNLSDFPLDHEIVEMGDYYRDQAVPTSKPTYFYGVLGISETVPNIPHTVLDDLYLYSKDEELVRQAITRIGFDPDSTGYAIPGPDWDGNDPVVPDPPDPGPLVKSTNCGCKSGFDKRNPGGCIKVEDRQLGAGDCNHAVRQAKVVVRDAWLFATYTTYTNDGGCFRLYDVKFEGEAWLEVKFTNEYSTTRMTGGAWGTLINYSLPVTDGWINFGGPDFRNMDRCYKFDDNIYNKWHRFWRAATIHNSVLEYRDFCWQQNITPIPVKDLSILTTIYDNSGAAPMVDKIYDAVGVVIPTGNPYGWIVLGIAIIPGNVPFAAYLAAWAPDIVINLNNQTLLQSDRIKELCYHELAHAQHFSRMHPSGRYSYWLANINYTIDNLGYGDGSAPGAERCQVIENWGFHMGPTVADAAYGLDHSLGNGSPISQSLTRHINGLEGLLFVSGHIQAGLFNDIHDVNPSGDPFENPAVSDSIGSYDHRLILQEMTHNITTPGQLRDAFRTNHVPASQVGRYNSLMGNYGL